MAKFWTQEAAFDVRHVDGAIYLGPPTEATGQQAVWFRSRGPLPDDQLLHRALLAYACDQVMLEPILRRAGRSWVTRGLSIAVARPRHVVAPGRPRRRLAAVRAVDAERAGRPRARGRAGVHAGRDARRVGGPGGHGPLPRLTLPARTATGRATLPGMVRLRRVRIDAPGWSRRRAGRGFVYLDLDKVRIVDEEHLERITTLAIPPAWREVWISPWPNGHIQAAGLDDAERRQYLYHQQWTVRRGRLKHDHVLDVARRLPAARRRVRADLALEGMPRQKVLALAFRLLDLAYLRVGGEGYALQHGSYGLATLLRSHVRVLAPESEGDPGRVHLNFPAKSGQVRDTVVEDDDVAAPGADV